MFSSPCRRPPAAVRSTLSGPVNRQFYWRWCRVGKTRRDDRSACFRRWKVPRLRRASAWNPVGTAIKTRRRAGGYFRSSSTTYGGAVAITAPRQHSTSDGQQPLLLRVRFCLSSLQAQKITFRLGFGSHPLRFEFDSVICGLTVLICPQRVLKHLTHFLYKKRGMYE